MRSPRTPSLRRHKPSSLGVVTLNGKDHYLGHWPAGQKNPPEAVRLAYDQLIAEWLAAGRQTRHVAPEPSEGISISELLLAFWGHAEHHYRHADGTPTSELNNLRASLRLLRQLYGLLPVTEFSPLKLKALRQKMIDSRRHLVRLKDDAGVGETKPQRWAWEHSFRQTAAGCEVLCRKKWRPAELLASKRAMTRGVINQRVGHVLRVFRWGVAEELVPETVHRALASVPGLRQGRTEAHEGEGVKPVAVEAIEMTLPQMPAPVAAMVRLQLLTGMRAGEAMVMRAIDLTMSGPVWTYRPASHKNTHRGRERLIFLGPQAQEVIKPFLTTNLEAYLFSPRVYVAMRRAQRAAARATKRTPSEMKRRRKAKPKRVPGERYTRRSYRLAVVRACQKAGVPPWSPLQLRHTSATRIRARYGLEAAKAILGHTRVETSQIYAERDMGRAEQIMREIG
jgi:integrase